MGDEDEIERILSDMDAILSGAEPPAVFEPSQAPPEPSQPPPAAAAQPVRPDAVPQGPQDAAAAAAQPVRPSAIPEGPQDAAAAAAQSPAPAPATPIPAAEPIADVAVPEKLSKEQVRRVAFIYLPRYAQERDAFGKFLENAAGTIAKKPLFLRTVLLQPVTPENSPADVLARVQQARAVAVLALLEGMPEARIKEYADVMGAGGLMFRLVAPGEAQKRSLAVDIVVDMMLLAAED